MAQYNAPESIHIGTGVETVFGFSWPVMVNSDLYVTVNGTPVSVVLVSPNQVAVHPAPAHGAIVRIYRDTPAQSPAYLFSGGIPFLPRYVDENNKQVLYALQEGLLAFAKVGSTATQALTTANSAHAAAALAVARSLRSLRAPDSDPVLRPLASVPERAGRVLGFDMDGQPVGTLPASGSGTELAMQLASKLGSSLVGYRGRDVYLRLSEYSSVKDEVGGVAGAVGDGIADDTDAIQAHVDAHRSTWVPEGTYKITRTIVIPPRHRLICGGSGYFFDATTKFLFYGTGAREHVMVGCTGMSIANPDAGAPYLADSGTRGDAYVVQDMTLPFSVGFKLGKASRILGGAAYPEFDGVEGYKGNDGRLGADWDVGVLASNSDAWQLQSTIVVGHWRKAALVISATPDGSGIPSNELGNATRCQLQGFRAVMWRSPEVNVGENYGFAGTVLRDCVLRPLNHQSARLATSSYLSVPFDSPSGILEASGGTIRGVYFERCTFIGRDDICCLLNRTGEMRFNSCYFESKSVIVNGSWLNPSLGSRMVATTASVGLRFFNSTQYGVDFSPAQTVDGSLRSGRYSKPGVFTPSGHYDDDYCMRVFQTYIAHRLRTASDRFIIAGSNDATIASFDEAGLACRFYMGLNTGTVANDSVVTVPTPRHGGHAVITYLGGTEVNGPFPLVSASGALIYDTGSSPSAAMAYGGGSFKVVAGDVTGTTGTSPYITVGVVVGALRIENRTGGPSRIRVTFTG